jgi:hypothetical protein
MPAWRFAATTPNSGEMAAQRVDRRGALADQLVAHAMQYQRRLLVPGLHRHEAHARPLHRLAARLGVGRIVLVALDVGLDVLRRHQPCVVAEDPEFARPVVRAAAGLEADPAARQVGEQGQHFGARQPLAQPHPALRIDAVHLEHVLRNVQPDRGNLHLGRLPCSWLLTTPPWHTDAVSGRRPSHYATVAIPAAGLGGGARTSRIAWTSERGHDSSRS